MSGTLKYPSLVGGEQPASFLEIISTAGIGTTDYITFKTGAQVERLRIDSTGLKPGASDGGGLGTSTLMWSDLFLASGGVINWNNDVTLTHSAGSLALLGILALTTGQLAFPAAQNASADVNTLDDYEEGTFNPILRFGGNNASLTYTKQVGNYVKVGKLVFVEINIIVNSNGSSTGAATITGLPFTSNATSVGILNFVQQAVMDQNGLQKYAQVAVNGTTAALFIEPTAGGQAALTDVSIPDASGFSLSGHYIAAA